MASHPTKIGKYNVEGILGRGGMGVVYKALDSQINRFVAIKMINAGGDESLLTRFKQEAKSMGQLTHSNIVTVFDFGEQDGNPYLVMQYLEGSSLQSMIERQVPLTLSERLGIIIDVCNGLAYAHQRGVIHRDIKPGNIMVLQDGVNDGMAVIVDFGIARIGGDTGLTGDRIIGSFHYMAAEQFLKEELDNRTDIYAVGVVLFQLLTGALPFDATTDAALMYQIVHEPPPLLSKYLNEYPSDLEAIVSHALAKKREERYANAKDVAFDLMQVQERLKSETVAQWIQRAELSFRREEWTRAREHLQQVLRLDRQNTQAQKLMTTVQDRLRQVQQIEQARVLRDQAGEAYMEQRYDDAIRILGQAVTLDGTNSDLLAFLDSVRSDKERAMGLRRALRRAEAALQDGDLDEALSAVSEAFKIDPQDTQAKALKVIIAQQAEDKVRQERMRKLLDEARSHIAARKITAAFTVLKNAEALDPTSNELIAVVKLAMATREQEKRRKETEAFRQQIEAALREEDYATAVARAEEGLRKFPQDQSLLKLKGLVDAQRLRVEQKKFVREQFSAANSLADSGQLRQAVAVLERALQRAPGNNELESLRATFLDRLATDEAGQRRDQAVEAVLAEGARILQERGARDATEFLATRADEYSDYQPFRELYDSVRERAGLDALDSRLANEPHPARQIQLAEEAWRQNPINRWIQQRVADLRQRKDQINAVIVRAQGLEAAGHLPAAMEQWQQLSETYPQVPEFDAHVRRIGSELENRNKTAPQVVEPRMQDKSADVLSATNVLDSEALSGGDTAKAGVTSKAALPPVVPQPKRIEPPRERVAPPKKTTPPVLDSTSLFTGRKKYIPLASAVIVLIVVGYWIFGGGKAPASVIVSITTAPAGADVTVGIQKCRAPCELSLRVGPYELRAERDGYQPATESVTIATYTRSLPMITLKPMLGSLLVRAHVNEADVFVGAELKGMTEGDGKFQIPLPVGPYEITVKKSGYEEQLPKSIKIDRDATTAVDFDLRILQKTTEGPKPLVETYLLVVCDKPGANVSIDQRPVGTIPATGPFSWKVDPRAHSVDVTMEGYKPFSERIVVKEGDRKRVTANLDLVQPPPQPPRIYSFTPSATSIKSGERVQLTWKIENANEVSIDQNIGRVDGTSIEVRPTADITYTLTAKGPFGNPAQSSTKVMVVPIAQTKITVFKAANPNLEEGLSTDLVWATENATAVSIKSDTGPDIGDVGLTDARSVSPSKDTTYTLTATGPGGPVQRSAKVTVQPKPKGQVSPSGGGGGEEDAVRDAIRRYEEAYRTTLIGEVKKEWPSISKKEQDVIKGIYTTFRAPRLQINCNKIEITGDSAQCTGSQTLTYTERDKTHVPCSPDGKPSGCIPSHPAQVGLKKTGGVWHIDNIR